MSGEQARGLREPGLLARIRASLLGRPKRLPFECFYDDLGSALFEAITHLPEYGLSRAGLRLLRANAGELVERLGSPLDVVELGSGSGRKARVLLEQAARSGPVVYHPVDISAVALDECRREVGRVDGLSVEPVQASHLDGLRLAVARRRAGYRLLVLFLGGNIGNFERDEALRFLRAIREAVAPGDALLVGADLEKPEAQLLPAYDDALGVTAAFNRNALARLNRELLADFDLARFRHQVRYDRAARRIEAHLVSLGEQRVRIPGLDLELRFADGETLWTESSHRFAPGEMRRIGEAAGYLGEAEWVDAEWPFAQTLLRAFVRPPAPSS